MKNILIIISIITLSFPSFGQGWNQKKGEGYFQLNELILTSSEYYNGTVKTMTPGTYNTLTTSLYGEYGLTDKFMLIGYIPFVSNSYEDKMTMGGIDAKQSKTGLGEVEIGAAYGIITDKNFVMNVYANASFPIDSKATSLGVRISDSEPTQKLRLAWGYGGFYPIYMNGYFGIENRTNGFSDSFVQSWAIGYKIKEKFIIAAKYFSQHSFFNGKADEAYLFNMYANNQEYWAVGPEFIYEHKEKYGYYIGFRGGSMARNIIASSSVKFGFYYKLKDE